MTIDQKRRPRKYSTGAALLLGRIYDEFVDKIADFNHIFIQIVFNFYANEIGLFNAAERDNHLKNFSPEHISEIHLKLTNTDINFRWKALDLTGLSSLVESTINPRSRKFEGIHYISAATIHKLIDLLFFDELRAEFSKCNGDRQKLIAFQDKIAALTFFDPACGCGNFLIETYVSLRRLENEIIRATGTPIKVSVEQFYGIEINDFAVEITKTALWLAENQMLRELDDSSELTKPPKFKHILCANSLNIDWKKFAPNDINYVMGNPPSMGMTRQSREVKAQIDDVFRSELGRPYAKNGKLDYAACWFFKAAQLMHGRQTRTAFVATDSICQSELAQLVWQPLINRFKVHIDFAYRPFRWIDDCMRQQRLACIAAAFSSAPNERERFIVDGGRRFVAKNINAYLLDAPSVFVTPQPRPLCEVPEIHRGNQATDGGNLIIEEKDYETFIRWEPSARKYIRRFMMGREFINNLPRWCLWLKGVTSEELKKMPLVAKRIEAVKKFREASTFIKTRRLAKKPHLFREQITPERYIAIPKLSSDRRKYLTAGWLDSSVIAGDQLFMIENAGLYEFGVLESSVHMAWVRAFGGRFTSGFSYSKTIIYNNFVWPKVTEEQRLAIERTAQGILEARAKYPDITLAKMYDVRKMPEAVLAAHEANDAAVLAAYGFEGLTDAEIVSRLLTARAKLLGLK